MESCAGFPSYNSYVAALAAAPLHHGRRSPFVDTLKRRLAQFSQKRALHWTWFAWRAKDTLATEFEGCDIATQLGYSDRVGFYEQVKNCSLFSKQTGIKGFFEAVGTDLVAVVYQNKWKDTQWVAFYKRGDSSTMARSPDQHWGPRGRDCEMKREPLVNASPEPSSRPPPIDTDDRRPRRTLSPPAPAPAPSSPRPDFPQTSTCTHIDPNNRRGSCILH